MTVNMNVVPTMVTKLKIESQCLKSLPCQHPCQIKLSDGRKKSLTLSQPDIDILVQGIAREKIRFKPDLSHFLAPLPENAKKAEDILTRIFNL